MLIEKTNSISSRKIKKFNGEKFALYEGKPYYISLKTGFKLMHHVVWEFYKDKTPKDYIIHHKDFDKTNNAIENLECISKLRHAEIHSKGKCSERKRKNLDNIRHLKSFRIF